MTRSRPESSLHSLPALLKDTCRQYGVVGATLGLVQNGQTHTAAHGVLNLDTGVETTADSVFQIGSISKAFTATLILQLADHGRLLLDDPVREHLPDFAVADADASASITVRQLLTHTSGMAGDFFPEDDPTGPSAASYVRKMRLLPQLYAPGDGPMSYCNSGYVVLGRIAEVLFGRPWPQLVMERICYPLGLRHCFADPRDSLRFRCAMGHATADAGLRVVPKPFLPLSCAASGSVLSMSVGNLLRFAQVHLNNGQIGCVRLLSARIAQQMRSARVDVPTLGRRGVTHWGLGWFLGSDGMFGHDGGTAGQYAWLRCFPKKQFAFALLTNAPGGELFAALEKRLMQDYLGRAPDADPAAEPCTFEPRAYTGRYAHVGTEFRISGTANELTMVLEHRTEPASPAVTARLRPHSRNVFSIESADPALAGFVSFTGQDECKQAQYLRLGLRLARRKD